MKSPSRIGSSMALVARTTIDYEQSQKQNLSDIYGGSIIDGLVEMLSSCTSRIQ